MASEPVKIDITRPAVTRDGWKATNLRIEDDYTLLAEIEEPNGAVVSRSFDLYGRWNFGMRGAERFDLRNVDEMPRIPRGLEAAKRKDAPMARGLLDYFPDALWAVAELSRIGNEQHNPGQPLHWAREKSTDHADCIVRHLKDRGKIDSDGVRHSVKVAWRALALAQIELEEADNLIGKNTREHGA